MDLYKKGLTNYQNVLDSQRNVLNYENVYVNSQSKPVCIQLLE